MALCLFSPQNVDRLVSIFRATCRTSISFPQDDSFPQEDAWFGSLLKTQGSSRRRKSYLWVNNRDTWIGS